MDIRIRKADIVFILAILAAALISFVILRLYSTQGSYAIVSHDGVELPVRISLEESAPRYFLITYENMESDSVHIEEFSEKELEKVQRSDAEYNILLYQDNEIRMIQSSCPDKICVNHSAISMTGENIICLPHKLVIEISGGGEHDLDGVAY